MKHIIILAIVFSLATINAQAQLYTPTGTVTGSSVSPNVGVGSTAASPTVLLAPLHVRFSSNTNANDMGLVIERSNGSQPSSLQRGVAIAFKDGDNPTLTAGIAGIRQSPTSNFNGDLAFFTNGTGASSNPSTFANMTERMRIRANGYVGIGTSDPKTRLDLGELRFGLISEFPVEGSVSESIWGTFIASDLNNLQRLRIGVVNDSYTRAEIFLDNSNTINGSISFKTTNIHAAPQTRLYIAPDGKIGVGLTNPGYLLSVNGVAAATEVQVKTNVGADYVFESSYDLLPLTELEKYLKVNKHLPEVPPAKEMIENGIKLSEMNVLLLKKVEELTLYMIELKKENEAQKKINELQQQEIEKIKAGKN